MVVRLVPRTDFDLGTQDGAATEAEAFDRSSFFADERFALRRQIEFRALLRRRRVLQSPEIRCDIFVTPRGILFAFRVRFGSLVLVRSGRAADVGAALARLQRRSSFTATWNVLLHELDDVVVEGALGKALLGLRARDRGGVKVHRPRPVRHEFARRILEIFVGRS